MVRYRDLLSDTICAPITAPGYSGVAVLRVSGENSLRITKRLCNQEEKEFTSHTCRLATFNDENGQPVDQVLITFFEKGRSFTGDETVEISCHGNPLIVNQIARQYLNEGCRSAEKGEFSFRAFYNGNIDLIQAESIQQLVVSKNAMGSENSLAQLSGKLSIEFKDLEESLISCMAHLEATIDFVEQDIEPEENQLILVKLKKALEKNQTLLESYSTGKNLNKSSKILLLGETNVGKSSLFNWLIEKDRAIVTEVAGTTRDMVSDQTFVGNYSVEFFDSAGLRMTDDLVEGIGIQKTLKEAENADIILYVLDARNLELTEAVSSSTLDRCVWVFNKMDLVGGSTEVEKVVLNNFNDVNKMNISSGKVCFVSALKDWGRERLISEIKGQLGQMVGPQESAMITQARHFDHLNNLNDHLLAAQSLLEINESPDLVSQELALGLSEVHMILGKEYNDEVLDKIFSDFCIGK